jgi:hypothetical protein
MVFPELKKCWAPLPAAADDDALMRESPAMLERHNIRACTDSVLCVLEVLACRMSVRTARCRS